MTRFWLVILLVCSGLAGVALAHPASAPAFAAATILDASDVPLGAAEEPALLQPSTDRSNGRLGNIASGAVRPRSAPGQRAIVAAEMSRAHREDMVSPLCERLPYDATAPPLSV